MSNKGETSTATPPSPFRPHQVLETAEAAVVNANTAQDIELAKATALVAIADRIDALVSVLERSK